jgi:predicted RNase H-like HicB family nuclease
MAVKEIYDNEAMEASVVTLSVKLEATTKREGDRWVAHCVPLDVYSQADTKAKSLASLTEAVELWFESCLDRDVLSEALAEVGFNKV